LSKLPRNLSGKELINKFGKAGFLPQDTDGSHVYLRHPNGKAVTVPLHPEIGPGLMTDIMNELGLTRKEFLELLQDPKKYNKEHSNST